jgi:hypothetical protein
MNLHLYWHIMIIKSYYDCSISHHQQKCESEREFIKDMMMLNDEFESQFNYCFVIFTYCRNFENIKLFAFRDFLLIVLIASMFMQTKSSNIKLLYFLHNFWFHNFGKDQSTTCWSLKMHFRVQQAIKVWQTEEEKKPANGFSWEVEQP